MQYITNDQAWIDAYSKYIDAAKDFYKGVYAIALEYQAKPCLSNFGFVTHFHAIIPMDYRKFNFDVWRKPKGSNGSTSLRTNPLRKNLRDEWQQEKQKYDELVEKHLPNGVSFDGAKFFLHLVPNLNLARRFDVHLVDHLLVVNTELWLGDSLPLKLKFGPFDLNLNVKPKIAVIENKIVDHFIRNNYSSLRMRVCDPDSQFFDKKIIVEGYEEKNRYSLYLKIPDSHSKCGDIGGSYVFNSIGQQSFLDFVINAPADYLVDKLFGTYSTIYDLNTSNCFAYWWKNYKDEIKEFLQSDDDAKCRLRDFFDYAKKLDQLSESDLYNFSMTLEIEVSQFPEFPKKNNPIFDEEYALIKIMQETLKFYRDNQ